MKRSGPPRRKRRPNVAAEYEALRMAAMWRATGACQAQVPDECEGRGCQAHHLLPRSAGGRNELENLAWVCTPCHSWIHAQPEQSYDLGLLRRRQAVAPFPWSPEDLRPAWRPADAR